MTDEECIWDAKNYADRMLQGHAAACVYRLIQRLKAANADAELLASCVERVPKAWQFVEDADALAAHLARVQGK